MEGFLEKVVLKLVLEVDSTFYKQQDYIYIYIYIYIYMCVCVCVCVCGGEGLSGLRAF